MLSTRLEALRDAAARPIVERIRRDRSRAPQELKPLLAYSEEHLFDVDFSVEGMKRACQIRDNSIVTRFRRFFGSRPSTYIKECRLAAGAELLRGSTEDVWKIAELVGYSSPQLFARNFKEVWGATPVAYRKQHGGRAEATTPVAETGPLPHELRKALDGSLDQAGGEALIQHLEALYRPGKTSTAQERSLADGITDALRCLPRESQLTPGRGEHAEAGRSVFQFLRQLSRLVGRRNRMLGVRFAELALASLEESAQPLGGDLPSLRALGWAWVGNARRLALDFPGAEQAFERADAEWNQASPRQNDAIKAEICTVKAGFRTIQHRFEDALKLIGQSADLLGERRNQKLQATNLILRASITDFLGDCDASIADLELALRLSNSDGRLELNIYQNLATACADAARYEQAEAYLPEAQRRCAAYGDPLHRFQLLWVAARISKGLGKNPIAETQFLAARAGFRGLGQSGHAGMVSLDLALLWRVTNRPVAKALVAEAVEILEVFGIHQAAHAARVLLQNAIVCDQLTLEVLHKARRHVTQFMLDPAVSITGRFQA